MKKKEKATYNSFLSSWQDLDKSLNESKSANEDNEQSNHLNFIHEFSPRDR